jgi:hypothetical protein
MPCHYCRSASAIGRHPPAFRIVFTVEEEFLLGGLTIAMSTIRSYLGVSVVILLCIKWKLEGIQHPILYPHI